MPSEYQPAYSDGREHYPRLREDLGEDPARFLDRDVFEHGIVRLEEREFAAYDESPQKVIPDDAVSSPGEVIRDRISGIDDLAVARAWRAIERRLDRTPEGGREFIIELIEDRIDELEANGERDQDGRDAEELRELGAEAYEAAAPKDDVVYRGPDGEVTSRTTGTTAAQKLAALADGGEEQ